MDLKPINHLIQQGNSRKARQHLQLILRPSERARFTREERLELASLCRRTGWFQGALVVLAPIVRPSSRSRVQASDAEKTEYASNLIQMGSRQEGRLLLSEVSPSWHPKYFVEALSYFSEWNYHAAIPLLRRYLDWPEIQPYARIIGQVNLAAALVFENEIHEAETLLRHLKETCEREGHSLMLGNVYEIWSQLALKQDQTVEKHLVTFRVTVHQPSRRCCHCPRGSRQSIR